ncbi:MAG TPA: CPBP family intramembrane glutamic endopeptidase [Bryobacteraceae bacterium]|nr:CPBP family intramembrane glutamic endopeptidase [Bryobacteraceae bacterium]
MSETLMHTNQPPDADSPLASAPPEASSAPSAPPGAPLGPPPFLRERSQLQDRLFAFGRWLIYLVLLGILLLVFSGVEGAFRSRHHHYLLFTMMSELVFAAAVILPGFIMAPVEGRPFADFGLPARGAFGRNFWIGTLWGFSALSVLMLALHICGAYEFGSIALSRVRIVRFAVYYAFFFLLTGFAEDFLSRGYSQWILTKVMGFWPAAALMSVAFGAIHSLNPGESKSGIAAAGLLGFFFCLTLRRTGNLWWAVGFHMSWDWCESFFYSVPDSGQMSVGHLMNSTFHGPNWLTGGTAGPEGSLLVFVLIAALWALFSRIYPEVRWGQANG